jgi:hypothetical protein
MCERKFLTYFYEDGRIIESKKYTVDTDGNVRWVGKESGPTIHYKGGYALIGIRHENKQYVLRIGRIVASTFIGPPPDFTYTIDHKNRIRSDDRLVNICWSSKYEQTKNRDIPETLKTAFIIVKDGKEMTAKEWMTVLKKQNGGSYVVDYITQLAQQKKHGFSYKEYPDLQGEEWKLVVGSENKKGRWEISNMCRLKYVTQHAENVISNDRIGVDKSGYPVVGINGKTEYCHVILFATWFPDLYALMKEGEMILHKDDDPMDFRPHKLRIGTRSENLNDAHDNGKYDDKKTTRMRCISHVENAYEKEFNSLTEAVSYLRENGHPKADKSAISLALSEKQGTYKTAYGRTWKRVY